jgi:hypothetical protein
MANDKIYSNKRVGWFVGPETSISDWTGPSLANLQALANYSAGIRIGGSDFNVQATEQVDDRSFADEVGAKSLGYAAFGGNVSSFVPTSADTVSTERQAHNTFKRPRVRLAVLQRYILDQSTALAAGQEVNLFRVITDAENTERRQNGYSITTELVAQDDVLVNYIIPAATPAAITVGGATTGTVGGAAFLSAVYQNRTATLGVTWTSSDETKAIVSPHGLVRFLAAGSVTITASYPGGTAGTKAITIS